MLTLSSGDLFALMLALFASTSVLTLAFRRIYVLEKQALKLRRELRLHTDPTIWSSK